MRVLVAGSTGVIGRSLVPLLTAVGHEVVEVSRKHGTDLLDRDAVRRAVRQAAPDAVVHVATAIPAAINPRTMARDFALTNRLRTEGLSNLIDAAPGVRLVVQGLAYPYRHGEGPADEDTPLLAAPPRQFASSLAALTELERLTGQADGLVLRFGHLYGPGTAFDAHGSVTAQIRQGKMPIVGRGESVFSFTHVHDAATAIVASLDRDVTGALNVVDDDPAPVYEWLPAVAEMLGAPAPRRIPVFAARLVVGGWGVTFMNELRGAANTRARLRLDWRPRHATWRRGLASELVAA
ncbi:NAD(P)-dependent oxidoreductase [Streptosporangium sp. 'caverna']|uniref:NAD-dependent epimerase/dehydratase family protein n=1 Tax=Streptosporangium sp. 'caverna' TaxID=2202249 RepID=UPI000D7D31B5|nr:NAD(P)-dependent oxidoreductase [Streptosporangium sp. 'caverna']AWS40478.1 NAD(P)-dependent oxidoreductase [Streptosporangium sp. 'caverna']